jgi:hypothetical protein
MTLRDPFVPFVTAREGHAVGRTRLSAGRPTCKPVDLIDGEPEPDGPYIDHLAVAAGMGALTTDDATGKAARAPPLLQHRMVTR